MFYILSVIVDSDIFIIVNLMHDRTEAGLRIFRVCGCLCKREGKVLRSPEVILL